MDPIIQVQHLCKTFQVKGNVVDAAKNISFDIERGDIFGIIGLSGAGKSTLVRCLNLLEQPTSGDVIVDGKNLTKLSDKELRLMRRDIGMIFQHFNLLMQKTVLDNVCFPMKITGVKGAKAKERAMELLRTVGLEDKANAYPAQLSGGQKQRVAIARVLANNPKILLCDEATSALDPQTTKSILGLLKSINEAYGITIVVITHEMAVVQEICHHVAVLDHGTLAESGTVQELFRSPKTEAARKLILTGTEQIKRMKGEKVIRITFSGQSSFEPVIGNLVLEYKTPVNILYANTRNIGGNAEGEMILQLPEMQETAQRMIADLKEKNLGVEVLDHYVG
ncbi:MAG: methionine ABC transporter ATP-binding protein [Lachnospiraceae bacterium]